MIIGLKSSLRKAVGSMDIIGVEDVAVVEVVEGRGMEIGAVPPLLPLLLASTDTLGEDDTEGACEPESAPRLSLKVLLTSSLGNKSALLRILTSERCVHLGN